MTAVKLGELIREARTDKGIGQKELARTLKKTASTLSQVETGQLIPGEQLLQSLCQLLDIDYGLAGRIAQLEKSRSEFQRVAALESLNRYERNQAKSAPPVLPPGAQARPGMEGGATLAGASQLADFVVIPTTNEKNLEDQTIRHDLAFSQEWLKHQGGASYKKFIIAPGKEMAPLINKGDLILIDASPNGRQIKAGRIYALHNGRHFMLRRIYYGSNPNSVILAAENKNEYPDQEICLNYESGQPVIFGRVFWLARDLDQLTNP